MIGLKLIAFIVLPLFSIGCQNDNVNFYVFNKGFEFGIVNSNGDTVLNPTYSFVRIINSDTILLYKEEKMAITNTTSLQMSNSFNTSELEFNDFMRYAFLHADAGGCEKSPPAIVDSNLRDPSNYIFINYKPSKGGYQINEFKGRYCYINDDNRLDTLLCSYIPYGMQYHKGVSEGGFTATSFYSKPTRNPDSILPNEQGRIFSGALLTTISDMRENSSTLDYDYYLCDF